MATAERATPSPSTERDWTKPRRWRFPKGDFSRTKLNRQVRPDPSQDSGVLRLLRHCKSHPRKGRAHIQPATSSRKQSQMIPNARYPQGTRLEVAALPLTVELHDVSGHLRDRFR